MHGNAVVRQAGDGLWQIESGVFASNCYVHSVSRVGLSNLPNEDRQLLRENILSFWASISTTVLVCPGHGPTARFGDICLENQALLEYLKATD